MVKRPRSGYTLLILMVGISLLLLGMAIAFPALATQAQREKEAELLFCGGQYVEAVRLYLRNNPGNFPESIEDLVESRYLRKAYADPMTKDGKWNLILLADQTGGPATSASTRNPRPTASGRGEGKIPSPAAGQAINVQRVMIVPESSLGSVAAPRIIGVVSSSDKKSFLLYNDNETYDTWLFYYGRAKGAKPEVIRFGDRAKK